jgi:hypothetical protein
VPVNDAKLLMAKLAIECTRLALPALPLLHVEDLMEFRDANEPALGAALAASSTLEFRRVNSQKPLSNLACFVRVRTPTASLRGVQSPCRARSGLAPKSAAASSAASERSGLGLFAPDGPVRPEYIAK